MRILIISALFLVLASFLTNSEYFTAHPPIPNYPDTILETPIATSAGLNTTLGQHFMIGHWAETPVASTTDRIREYGIGGVIIMSAPEDPRLIYDWISEWQAVSPTPLLIAIDQEGGPVSRLRNDSFDLTGQAQITTTTTAYTVGRTRGAELRALGINMNFSPVLDTATDPTSFMFTRVFPNRQSSPALAAAMVDGLADAGVIGVVKHFPGHDDTSEDSHVTLPQISYTGIALDDFLAPFSTLLSTQPPQALMTAHVAFPEVDPLPVTLSPYWLKTYLREQQDFSGVIITDDMIMDAIDTQWSHEEASVMALAAGADIILYAAEPEKVPTAIAAAQAALTEERLSTTTLQESFERIERLRLNSI